MAVAGSGKDCVNRARSARTRHIALRRRSAQTPLHHARPTPRARREEAAPPPGGGLPGPPQPPYPPQPPQPPYPPPPRKRRRSGPKQHKLRHQKRLRNQQNHQHAKRPAKAKKRQPSEDEDSEERGEKAGEEASQRSAQPVVAGRRCHEGDQCDDGRSCPPRGRCTGDGRECDADRPCSVEEGGDCERRCPAKGPKEARRKHKAHPSATTASDVQEASHEDTSEQPTSKTEKQGMKLEKHPQQQRQAHSRRLQKASKTIVLMNQNRAPTLSSTAPLPLSYQDKFLRFTFLGQ
ncbi:serine/arginine repetitive matrix protein 1-like [Rhipicephalus sanguineus]|uniref:serine/arginine repetitive matrix protein 1-like n=1 Tax=Rhipicephalus sanguineus TaxID=34632 RepID=UPI0020C29B93|nr:serine/arginine repetitive matrix protein 1-like [Rhipicephalus sanguineus]